MFAMKVQEAIQEEIRTEKFCLIVDESQEESKKEQIAIVARLFRPKWICQKRFSDLVHVKDMNVLTLKNEILSSISNLKLDVQDIQASKDVSVVHTLFKHLNFIVNVIGSTTKRNDQLQDAQLAEMSHLAEIGELEGGR
nr:hypothetical protein [Tanacetum cinerariifolium]